MILLSQQTNMFEAQAAIAKHAPQAISNVPKILIFQASKNKTNKRGRKKISSQCPLERPHFSTSKPSDHLGRMMS